MIEKNKKYLAIILILSSMVLYALHYLLFKDAHHIFIFLASDIAFVPIEILLVGLIFDQMIKENEKKHKLEKLNLIIGVFFTEIGKDLFTLLLKMLKEKKKLEKILLVKQNWKKRKFEQIKTDIGKMNFELKLEKKYIFELKKILKKKRKFLISLLQNPVILDHDLFTDLLRSVFYLEEELSDVEKNIEKRKMKIIEQDIKRTIRLLTVSWLNYAEYLVKEQKYIFDSEIKNCIGEKRKK